MQPVGLLLLGRHQLTLPVALLLLLGSTDAGVALALTADGLELGPLHVADAGRLGRGAFVSAGLSEAFRAAGPLRLEATREVPWDVVEDVAWRLGVAGCLDARLEVRGEAAPVPVVGAAPLAALVIAEREVTVCWEDGCEPPWRRQDPPRGLSRSLAGVTLVPHVSAGNLRLGDVLREVRALGCACRLALLRPPAPGGLSPLSPRRRP